MILAQRKTRNIGSNQNKLLDMQQTRNQAFNSILGVKKKVLTNGLIIVFLLLDEIDETKL
jgi:hypothetical protein